jgi:hypothetical protein
MKKVTLLLPDEITSVKGTFRLSAKEKVSTTPENLLKALVFDDYHMNFYFENADEIKIVAFEDCPH